MNAKFLTPVEGFEFLSTTTLDDVMSYRKYKDYKVGELVREVYGFDRSYEYSDDINAWRHGDQRFKELSDKIDESTDYDEEQKTSLRTGLTLRGAEQLVKTFPELNSKANHKIEDLNDFLLNGMYDEDRLRKVLDAHELISTVVKEVNLPYGSKLVMTRACSKYSRHDLKDFNKLLLNKRHNALVKQFENTVSLDDLNYFNKVRSLLSVYLNVGTKFSPDYQLASLVPDTELYHNVTSYPLTHVRFSKMNSNWELALILE